MNFGGREAATGTGGHGLQTVDGKANLDAGFLPLLEINGHRSRGDFVVETA